MIEIIVALLIFTVGALALAAGSAVVARTMAVNAARERAMRVTLSSHEKLLSKCAPAAGACP